MKLTNGKELKSFNKIMLSFKSVKSLDIVLFYQM